jgi:hypothetical protein
VSLDRELTAVTDAVLSHRKGLTSLQYVFLPGIKVTDLGIPEWPQALPKGKIRR